MLAIWRKDEAWRETHPIRGSSTVTRIATGRGRARLGNLNVHLSYHGENGTIRISRLAHEAGSGIVAAENDDVHAEDLDMYNIT